MVAVAIMSPTAPVAAMLQEQFFICQRCNVAKPYSRFSKDRHRKTGIKNWCKPCAYEFARTWVVANRERYNELTRNWKARNYEKSRATSKAWQQRNPEKMRQYAKAYKASNPHLPSEWNARRKAQKLQATPQWADRNAIQEIYRRARELTKATGIRHNVDHIVPLMGRDVCGLHVETNLQILTQTENFKKHLAYELGHQWR